MAFRPRFFRPPAGSFFLLGPRGTGKTTWLRERVPDALFVNLLRPETYRELTARPERLRELVLGSPGRLDVVVDEVQRVPELLNVVHDLIESPRRSALHSRRPIRTVRGISACRQSRNRASTLVTRNSLPPKEIRRAIVRSPSTIRKDSLHSTSASMQIARGRSRAGGIRPHDLPTPSIRAGTLRCYSSSSAGVRAGMGEPS